MAISEFEIKRIEKLVGQFIETIRPDESIRKELDIAFTISGQSFEIFEVRPLWNDPTKKMKSPVAKATYVKSKKHWKLYWQRADLKWHKYEPHPIAKNLEDVLEIIGQDKHHCFWG